MNHLTLLKFLNFLPIVPLAFFIYHILRVGWFGVELRKHGQSNPEWFLTSKMSSLNRALYSLGLFLVSIVVIATFLPHTPRNESLYHVHLFFAFAAFILLLLARFWITGLRYPKIHKWIVRSFYGCFSIALVLEVPRLFQW